MEQLGTKGVMSAPKVLILHWQQHSDNTVSVTVLTEAGVPVTHDFSPLVSVAMRDNGFVRNARTHRWHADDYHHCAHDLARDLAGYGWTLRHKGNVPACFLLPVFAD